MQLYIATANGLVALEDGDRLLIRPGQTLRVVYAFSYRLPERTATEIWASLFKRTIGVINREENAQTKTSITLEESATEWTPYSGHIDIEVGSVSAGTYGLILELPEFNEETVLEEVIEVTAAPGITEWMGPMMAMAMMMMMVPMMSRGME